MRYLYGDSSPFPHGFNFLSTLESFMACAARIVQLESEARSLQITTASAAAARIKALDDLERFHQVIVQAVQESTTKSMQAQTTEYSRQIVDFAARLVEETKRGATLTNDREQASVRTEVGKRRGEIRAALETFLVSGRLPTLEAKIAMQGGEGQGEFSAVLTSPEGIVSSFKLAASRLPAWGGPRKVSEFAHGVNLMVGVKKSLFRRTVEPELVNVDEYFVSAFDLTDTTAEIHLRKKVTERDTLIFKMHREEDGLSAQVIHPDETGDTSPTSVDAGDRLHLDRLWGGLRTAADAVLDHKERLLALRLDNEDVFENDLSLMFIERLIKYMAPAVAEIGKRSPNPKELSLKVESEGGRREEVYVKKDDLLAKIAPLGEKERAIFSPLGFAPALDKSLPDLSDIKFDEDF